MKLWLLRPRSDLTQPLPPSTIPRVPGPYCGSGNPWDPWYDRCFGFVIRAESEADARAIANCHHQDEGEVWTSDLVTCNELTPEGERGTVISDVWSA